VVSGWCIPSRDASIGVCLLFDCVGFELVTIFTRDFVTLGKERDIRVTMVEVLVDFVETAQGTAFLIM
jgi:hypothetical protein